ncbi:MAG: HlyD family efflux transporter periplasmic adaptor subunit [Deltaproteobacteria bacterium]|nr:HlyD family efflux transporter periplasmic adaptor subunit [Deltaproteobacteria bacterium]
MKVKRLALVILLLVGGGSLGYWLYTRHHLSKNHDRLKLSGHIKATETDLAFKVSGKIVKIHFDEGDWIKTGQVVAELEAQDLRDEVAQAQARMATARANLTKYLAGYRVQEIEEAKAAVAKAKADLDNKQIMFHRYQNLYERKTVSKQTRDQVEADFLMARANLKSAREQYDLRKEGFRKEDIDAAKAEFEQAKATLELAQTRLGYATITAPADGVVLVKPAEVGEVAAIGSTVVTLGLLDDIWFEGYIPETDLAKVRYGMKAEITTDSYPDKKYPAWVSFISSKPEFTPKSVETFKERVTLVYRTKIRCANPNHELKPGMPAQAVVLLDSQP